MSERRGDELLNQRVPASSALPAPEPPPGPGPAAGPADRAVAAGLRRAAAVSARPYRARSDDGTVAVTVDGRPRVRSVRIGGPAVRSGPGPLAARVAATVNRALAVAMLQGPQAGLTLLATLDQDRRIAAHQRLRGMRRHVLEMAGRRPQAGHEFETAARLCTSRPEKACLRERAEAARPR